MNKYALKLKQKRRTERLMKKEEKINKLWDELSLHYDMSKIEKTKDKMLEVYKITKEVDSKVSNKSAIIALVCSLITLYKEYSFNKELLLAYSDKLRIFINSFISNNRTILSLIEEIEHDYEVAIIKRCENLPHLNVDDAYKYSLDDVIIKSTVDNFSYYIGINAYAFMNYIALTFNKKWNAPDLELFISKSFDLYSRILVDSTYLHTLKNILTNECELDVNLNNGIITELINNKGDLS